MKFKIISNVLKQKSLQKKEVLKVKPGTWLEFQWLDIPNTVGLLLEKPERHIGDVSLRVWWPDLGEVNCHAVHSQVVRVVGGVKVPIVSKKSN